MILYAVIGETHRAEVVDVFFRGIAKRWYDRMSKKMSYEICRTFKTFALCTQCKKEQRGILYQGCFGFIMSHTFKKNFRLLLLFVNSGHFSALPLRHPLPCISRRPCSACKSFRRLRLFWLRLTTEVMLYLCFRSRMFCYPDGAAIATSPHYKSSPTSLLHHLYRTFFTLPPRGPEITYSGFIGRKHGLQPRLFSSCVFSYCYAPT